ncbi:sensor histidine kinase [Catenuloplanes atrovinosus]|uniref:histidine kinase n=1 Tax=Catenuloplanes atrovinosus TaxID=137266 RepID=A0AAE3YPW8_9ACTN|nr:nitrate- and nitrite sensing domain-containing protein [Catenuloplanes atrovinosus]MDR7277853.1 signal transduction histidine kinase [Catenuloplanes atrovinosus]
MLIIPSVAFLLVAAVQVTDSVRRSMDLAQYAREARLAPQITAVIEDLQSERDRTIGEVNPQKDLSAVFRRPSLVQAAMAEYYAATDASVAALRAAGGEVNGTSAWQASYTDTMGAVEATARLRTSLADAMADSTVDFPGYIKTVDDSYTRAITSLIALLGAPTAGSDRPELGVALQRQLEMAEIKEILARQRAIIFRAAKPAEGKAAGYAEGDLDEYSALRGELVDAVRELRVAGTPEQIAAYEATTRDQAALDYTRLESITLNSSGEFPAADDWWTASERRQAVVGAVEDEIVRDGIAAVDEASGAQTRSTVISAAAILVILLAAITASLAIGTSIVRPLKRLREQALKVAQTELPETLERLRSVQRGIPDISVGDSQIRGRDEIGEVARAFVAVHRSAVDVAREQASMRRNVNAMFVNLARRSQVLVERQLELLDELEREESDPDQLTNLFKLDHLAARMRRNDENLLVLAGSDNARRWRDPVALSAVVLASTAEIEDYTRVRHDAPDGVHVMGHAVADVVHLLAELLDNAAAFSPPSTVVRLSGRLAADGTVVLEVVDDGLGMTPGTVQELNQLLAEPPAVDVAASERMGLFVVSHLAARHGIRVSLRSGERGVVATVWLPPSVLTEAPAEGALRGPSTQVPALQASAPMALPASGAAPALPAVYTAPGGPPVMPGPRELVPSGFEAAGVVSGTVMPAAPVSAVPSTGYRSAAAAQLPPRPPVDLRLNQPPAPRAIRPSPRPAGGQPRPEIATFFDSAGTGPLPLVPKQRTGGTIPAVPTPPGPAPTEAVRTTGAVYGSAAAGVVARPELTPYPAEPTFAPAGPEESGGYPVYGSRAAADPPAPGPSDSGAFAMPSAYDAFSGRRAAESSGEYPVAAAPRPARPIRAEDVLGAASGASGGGTWWNRSGAGKPTGGTTALDRAPAAPAAPVTGGTNSAGLPMRVPMAQLPDGQGTPAPAGRAPERKVAELDPEATGTTLSRFYSGIRAAETEETENTGSHTAIRWEGDSQ